MIAFPREATPFFSPISRFLDCTFHESACLRSLVTFDEVIVCSHIRLTNEVAKKNTGLQFIVKFVCTCSP